METTVKMTFHFVHQNLAQMEEHVWRDMELKQAVTAYVDLVVTCAKMISHSVNQTPVSTEAPVLKDSVPVRAAIVTMDSTALAVKLISIFATPSHAKTLMCA